MGSDGVSAFVVADEDEVEALCETKLRAWSTVVVFTRSAREAGGIEVLPPSGSRTRRLSTPAQN